MLWLTKRKDGGPESPVDAYFLLEIKGFFSIALLKFNKGSREAFHTHAFNAWTWYFKGCMFEEKLGEVPTVYKRSLLPKFTAKDNNHKVHAFEDSWCLTFRGPWDPTWTETHQNKIITFTNGREIIKETTV